MAQQPVNQLLEAQRALQAQNRLVGDTTQTLAAAAADAPPAGPRMQPGLSQDDIQAIQGGGSVPAKIPTMASVLLRKQAILHVTRLWQVPVQEVALLYVIAACDGADVVQRVGEEMLRSRAALDAAVPGVDLEDAQLIGRAMLLFHGIAQPNTPASAKVCLEVGVVWGGRGCTVCVLWMYCGCIYGCFCTRPHHAPCLMSQGHP